MITLTHGNLFDSTAVAFVNAVNTVGVMGKGIALAFKQAYPDNFSAYAAACKRGEVQVGKMFVTERPAGGPRWIVNFPTKKHFRYPSKLEWIEAGLPDLARFIVENDVASIALPALGSGSGGLDWAVVQPCIERGLGSLPDVDIVVYQPQLPQECQCAQAVQAAGGRARLPKPTLVR